MKTILAAVMVMVGSVAYGQFSYQQQAFNSRPDMAKRLCNLARYVVATRGMVEAPGYRSDAVNGSGNPAKIALGDAALISGQAVEPNADALRVAAVAAETQGDMELSGGQFRQAYQSYTQANNLYRLAKEEYSAADAFYTGAREWWKLALH